MLVMYTAMDQTLVNSLYTDCGLDGHVITTKYIKHLFCNALVHVIHSGVSGQCSNTI